MTIHLAKDLRLVPLKSLLPYEKNARTHSDGQVEKIAHSIKEFGFTSPILIDAKKGIIAGHGRLAAAKTLGLKEVPVIELGHLTEAQKRAYIIADNKLALEAGWDAEMLQAELADLDGLDFDLSAIGFSDEELEAILEADSPEDVIAPGPAPTLRSQLETAAEESVERRERAERASDDAKGEEVYTKKVDSPIYTPKGEKPDVAELFDRGKTEGLTKEIDVAKVPDEIKQFLRYAAQRHTVFNYEKIAEFYAHAPKETQELMERSALVIIDFKKAIENGFVQMTKEIAEAYPANEEAE